MVLWYNIFQQEKRQILADIVTEYFVLVKILMQIQALMAKIILLQK